MSSLDANPRSALAILAQLRVQTAKVSKGMSLSVRSSLEDAPDGKRWEGVVPSGIPLLRHEFPREDAGNLRKQMETLTNRPKSTAGHSASYTSARSYNSYVSSKCISMNVLDPNEWERIGKQISSTPRPRSALINVSGQPSSAKPLKQDDDWRNLLRQRAQQSTPQANSTPLSRGAQPGKNRITRAGGHAFSRARANA